MPYARNPDLPAALRAHLPAEAQDIYREAFNNAWKQYASSAAGAALIGLGIERRRNGL